MTFAVLSGIYTFLFFLSQICKPKAGFGVLLLLRDLKKISVRTRTPVKELTTAHSLCYIRLHLETKKVKRKAKVVIEKVTTKQIVILEFRIFLVTGNTTGSSTLYSHNDICLCPPYCAADFFSTSPHTHKPNPPPPHTHPLTFRSTESCSVKWKVVLRVRITQKVPDVHWCCRLFCLERP